MPSMQERIAAAKAAKEELARKKQAERDSKNEEYLAKVAAEKAQLEPDFQLLRKTIKNAQFLEILEAYWARYCAGLDLTPQTAQGTALIVLLFPQLARFYAKEGGPKPVFKLAELKIVEEVEHELIIKPGVLTTEDSRIPTAKLKICFTREESDLLRLEVVVGFLEPSRSVYFLARKKGTNDDYDIYKKCYSLDELADSIAAFMAKYQ